MLTYFIGSTWLRRLGGRSGSSSAHEPCARPYGHGDSPAHPRGQLAPKVRDTGSRASAPSPDDAKNGGAQVLDRAHRVKFAEPRRDGSVALERCGVRRRSMRAATSIWKQGLPPKA